MRKVCVLVALAVAVLGVTGCETSTAARTATPWGSPDAAGSGVAVTKSDVCRRVFTSISGHMTPLGTALGQFVGYRAATDAPDKATAAKAVADEITDLATAITGDTAASADGGVVMAAQTASASLTALAGDATLLSEVETLDDVLDALDKLTVALQPLADACQ